METQSGTNDLAKLSAALVAAQADIRNPPCDAVNTHFRQRYATLAQCLDTVRPSLHKHGLTLLQFVRSNAETVEVETRLLHISGQAVSCVTAFPSKGTNIQQFGGVVTYLRRYALCAVLGIVGDADLDAEDAIERKAPKAAAAPAALPQGVRTIPDGFAEMTVEAVEPKKAKSGKGYHSVTLRAQDGRQVLAYAWAPLIAERLSASIGAPTMVQLNQRERDGKTWFDIADAI